MIERARPIRLMTLFAPPHWVGLKPFRVDFVRLYNAASRYNPGWIVSTVEESHLAADFLADAIAPTGAAPHTVRADRGGA